MADEMFSSYIEWNHFSDYENTQLCQTKYIRNYSEEFKTLP